jgi:hypothetical protein
MSVALTSSCKGVGLVQERGSTDVACIVRHASREEVCWCPILVQIGSPLQGCFALLRAVTVHVHEVLTNWPTHSLSYTGSRKMNVLR